MLQLVLLQSLCLFYNLSKCIPLFYIYIYIYIFFFISVAVILLAALALMVQFSLPCNIAGGDSILYYFILVFVKVFCGPNILLIMPVIIK